VLGAAIGSFAGGKLIQFGRRRMMLLFNVLAILAVGLTLFLNVYLICLGRLLFGFCGGIFGVALPRMIEETVPQNLLGPFGIVTNLSVNTGGLVAILMGAGLPDSADTAAMKSTQFWRIIFGLPWVF
jgi:MFS family permease